MNFFAVEIKRLIKSRMFWISVCIGCIITVSQFLLFSLPVKKYLDDFQPMDIGTLNPQIWLEKWIGGELVSPQAFFFFLIFPIIAVLPFAASLAFDRSSGYVAQFYIRGQRRNYYTAKYITTFLSGGVAVLIPLVLNIFLTMTVFPSLLPDPSTGTSMIGTWSMWCDFYFAHPYLYVVLYLFIDFLFAGAISVLALAIGRLVENSFVIISIPFLLYFGFYTVCSLGVLPDSFTRYSPFHFLSPAQRGVYNSIWAILGEWCLLMVISMAIYCIGAYKDEPI